MRKLRRASAAALRASRRARSASISACRSGESSGADDAGLGPGVPGGIGADGDDLAGGVDAGGVAGLGGVGLLVDALEEGDGPGLLAVPGAVWPVEHGDSLRAKLLRCLLGGGLGLLLAELLSDRCLDAAVVPGLAAGGLQAIGPAGEAGQPGGVGEGDSAGINLGADVLRELEEGQALGDVGLAAADLLGEAALGVARVCRRRWRSTRSSLSR